MASRRTLTPFVATVAAAALGVGGVLVGTAPVIAAPVRSDECTVAFTALEDEFGDVDIAFEPELTAEVEAQLDAIFVAYEAAVDALYAELDLDYEYDDVYQVYEAALDDLDGATEDLDEAETDRDAADDALTLAQQALLVAEESGDKVQIAVAVAVRDRAVLDLAAAVAVFDAATAAEIAAEASLAEVEVVIEAIDVLDLELEAALEPLLGDVTDIDYDRLLQLLTDVSLACLDTASEDDGTDTVGGPVSGPVSGPVGYAPVATPVSAGASFTG